MFLQRFENPSNAPDELAQYVSNKNFSDELFLFSLKVLNLTVFSIVYMIRIRFFEPRELIDSEIFGRHSTFVLLVLILQFLITLIFVPIQDGTEFLVTMTKIPSDDILESLFELSF